MSPTVRIGPLRKGSLVRGLLLLVAGSPSKGYRDEPGEDQKRQDAQDCRDGLLSYSKPSRNEDPATQSSQMRPSKDRQSGVRPQERSNYASKSSRFHHYPFRKGQAQREEPGRNRYDRD